MRKAVLTIFLFLSAAWGQAPNAWTPELSMQVQTIGDAVPSPDGRWVAYTQTRAVMETEKSEMLTHIFLARSDGSHRLQLSQGERGANSPSFSPDGRFVYFLSARLGRTNLWRVPVDGGEAEMLTDWKGELTTYRVSPGGRSVAFTGIEPSAEEERARRQKLDFRVVDKNPKNHALWLIPAEADTQGRRPARKLFDPAYHITRFEWSPDSRHIAFEHWPTPAPDDWPGADISEVQVANGTVRPLATTGAAEEDPHYSRDGRYLAYLRSSDPPRWTRGMRIVLLPRPAGAPRGLPATHDEQPNLVGWSADSSRLLFAEARGTRSALYAMPLEGPARLIYEPAKGVIALGARINTSGTHIAFAQESSEEAPEAFLLNLGSGGPAQVSRANADLSKPPLGETRRIEWKAADGLVIEGLLTYPAGYTPGKKYPLVLSIHGGPHGAFSETFIGRPGLYPYAAFAARGQAILRSNIRGSAGYGEKFRVANLNDWGGKDYQDLMAGVDQVIGMGVADPDRMAVMGWSYGGFMTSWVVTHTRRFKAAAVGAGVSNLWSQTGTSDIRSNKISAFGAPWDDLEIYLKHSPLRYVKAAATPTLILHGENDARVPISQGYELYYALKRLGVPTQMVVYPRTPHGPREPKFVMDIMRRHLAWMEKYVR